MKLLIGNLWFAAMVAMGSRATADTFSVYSIGNSLTEDLNSTLPILATNYLAPLGRTYSYGYQIRHGSDITYIFNHPDEPVTKDYYNSPAALTKALPDNHWDAVTFEPYYQSTSEPSTLATDTAAINEMIRLAQSNSSSNSTRFFIYAAWPHTTADDPDSYSRGYLAAASNKPSQPSLLSRDYISCLAESVCKTNAGVSIIPAGEVLYAIDQKMRAGEIPGFASVRQLYRDDYHLNGPGKNIVGETAYAVIFGQSPVGLDYVSVGPDGEAKYTKNLPAQFLDASGVLAVHDPAKMAGLKTDLKIMQQIAWDVIKHRNQIYFK